MVRRGIDNFIDMQMRFLTLAAKETDAWIERAKTGKAFASPDLAEIAREAMETFVRSQKKFLDVIAFCADAIMVVHVLQGAIGGSRLDKRLNLLCAVELCDIGVCPAPLFIPRAINKDDDSFH